MIRIKLNNVPKINQRELCDSILLLHAGTETVIYRIVSLMAQSDMSSSKQTDEQVTWQDSPSHHQRQMQMHLHWGSTYAQVDKSRFRNDAVMMYFPLKRKLTDSVFNLSFSFEVSKLFWCMICITELSLYDQHKNTNKSSKWKMCWFLNTLLLFTHSKISIRKYKNVKIMSQK